MEDFSRIREHLSFRAALLPSRLLKIKLAVRRKRRER